jgi:hypothetical protein
VGAVVGSPGRRPLGTSQLAWRPMDVPARYRCTACGNLTRFDVRISRTTREYHHFTVGGSLQVEDAEVLSETIDEVLCRWCGHGDAVVRLEPQG